MILYIAITAGVLIFCLILAALYSYGSKIDALQRRFNDILGEKKKTENIEDDIDKPLYDRLFKPFLRSVSDKLQKLTAKKDSSKGNKVKQAELMKKQLWQAGYTIGPAEYSLIRLFVLGGAAVAGGIIAAVIGYQTKAYLGAIAGIYAGFTIMRFRLKSRISKRRKLIEEQLPDVLDLLSINVEAGLGFEQAMLQVIGHFEGPLVDELNITYREMTMGRSRRDALTIFADRCDIDDIKTFAGAVIQAETLGISMKNVLRTQAAAIRSSHKSKVEEKAMKISVKILIPMVCFIFPVLLIVLMGPAAVKIVQQFAGK